METDIILSPIKVSTLLTMFSDCVNEIMEAKLKNDLAEKLYSTSATCKFYGISKVTLSKWGREGRIQEHRIGRRIFYKYSEMMASLNTLKRYRKSL